jgi:hypothetical protein
MSVLIFTLKIVGIKNAKLKSFGVFIEMYVPEFNSWLTFSKGEIFNGLLNTETKIDNRNKAHAALTLLLKENKLPEFRVIAENNFFSNDKKEVIAHTNNITRNVEQDNYVCNFDTFYFLEETQIKLSDTWNEIRYIATPFATTAALATDDVTKLAIEEKLKENETLANQLEKVIILQKKLEGDLKLSLATQKKVLEEKEVAGKAVLKLTAQAATLKEQVATLKKNETVLNKQLKAQSDYDKIKSANEMLATELTLKNTTIKDLNTLVKNNQKQLTGLKTEAAKLQEENASLKVTQRTLLQENKALAASVKEATQNININEKPIAVNSFYKNIVNEIDTADAASVNSNYKLSNISLKIKTLLNQDVNNSVSMQLLTPEKLKDVNGAMLSEVAFDITPIASNKDSSTVKVPKVIGLTETAARNVLVKAGLRLNSVFQVNNSISAGEAFKQAPLTDSVVGVNNIVTVIFSKHE